MEGEGGGTFVDGKRCDMYDGDLIITPNWTWHCHDNDSGQRAIWLDVLDLPLVGQLDAVFGDMKMGPGDRYPANSSTLSDGVYEKAGLAPVTRLAGVRHSPRLRYGWRDVLAVLEETPAAGGRLADGALYQPARRQGHSADPRFARRLPRQGQADGKSPFDGQRRLHRDRRRGIEPNRGG